MSTGWITPLRTEDQGRARFVWRQGSLAFAVDPEKGARLVEASCEGRNLLTGPDINAQNYGSTVWTTPQALWEWPPPPELDEEAYVATLEDDRLVCRGRRSVRLGVSFTKVFGVRRDTGALVMTTTVHNHARVPTKVGLWEVSRVRTGGLTFFPAGDGIYEPSKLSILEKDGFVWFAYDPAAIVEDQKLFADGSEGWLGHLDERTLLVKTFPKIPRASQAPGEAEIELYADRGHTYVEVEHQGAYGLLAPHATLSWEVTWRLGTLPPEARGVPGDAALLAFARRLRG